MRRRWRPRLGLVLGGTLAVVLCLPPAGIIVLRALSPVIGYDPAFWLVGAAIVVTTAILGLLLWRLLYGPIRTLALRARMAKTGDPRAFEPVRRYGTREMRDLGRAMLEMGRVLQGREAVLRSYADHVTHELKSPLTVVRGAAELLEDETLTPEARAQLLGRIGESIARMTALLDAQRALARAQEPFAEGQVRLSALLPALAEGRDGLRIEVAEDGMVPLAPDNLRLVLSHLIGNAAAHGAGVVRLIARPGRLLVEDDGSGVSPGNRDRIFEPFFTTRRAAGGTGMGLPIVQRLLEAHGATIRLDEGGAAPGAAFVIEFPRG